MNMQDQRLRIGLLTDRSDVAAWEHRMIEIIQENDYAHISLVVQNVFKQEPSSAPSKWNGDSPKSGNVFNKSIGKILDTVEKVLVGKPGQLPNAFERVDAGKLLEGIDVLKLNARHQGSLSSIEDDDLTKIRSYNIDVFVALGFQDLCSEMFSAARYGVWALRIGGCPVHLEAVAGYREVMTSSPVIESTLEILADDSRNRKVIFRSHSTTNDWSLADSRNCVQWKALHFVPRKLKELKDYGNERFFSTGAAAYGEAPPRCQEEPKPITNGERAILVWKKLLRKIGRTLSSRRYFEQWLLMYRFGDDVSVDLKGFKKLIPPKDRFWADPFVLARDNKFYVFMEELPYATNKGHISLLTIGADGTIASPVTVLETRYHLSYPFIFEFENDLYMIPESKTSHAIELYKCTAFPLKWEFQKNLMADCQAVDTTLIQRQGKWWMFTNRIETHGASTCDELFLYYSDDPLSSRWIPHPKNPVVSDARSARPAGRLFERNGRLYRPSQNCSGHYGYGFNFCEVTKLTDTDYEERVVERVEPNWDRNITSTHTINSADGITVVDCQLRRRR